MPGGDPANRRLSQAGSVAVLVWSVRSGCAFEASDLPSEPTVGVGGAESMLGECGKHGVRWVVERSESLSQDCEDGVLGSQDCASGRVVRRIAEHEEAVRMVGRRGKQAFVVRIAADDPVEHHHVGRLDAVRIGGDVVPAPFDAVLESGAL
jgi:hypothetical protein